MANNLLIWAKYSLCIWMILCTLFVTAHIGRELIHRPAAAGPLIDFDPPPKAR